MARPLFLGLGLVLLVTLVWRLGTNNLLNVLERIGWFSIPVFFSYFGHHATRAVALRGCVLQSVSLPYSEMLAIQLSGEATRALTFTGPVLAQPTRAWLLERPGLSFKDAFVATLTEYLLCAFVTMAMSVGGLLYLLRYFSLQLAVSRAAIGLVCAAVSFLVAAGIAITRRIYLIGAILSALGQMRILRGRLRPNMAWVHSMEDGLLAILHGRPGRVTAVLLIELAAQSFLVLELFWLLHALYGKVPYSLPLLIEASTKIIDFGFVFVPMQIGVAEGTYVILLGALGLPAAVGLAIGLARRARGLLLATIGLAALARMDRARARRL